jgi:hypothetical protein
MTRTTPILAATALMLAALIVLELTGAPATDDGTPEPALAQPVGGNGHDASGGAGTVAAILARPLFRADRRPAPADAHGGASSGPDLPRLTGILLSSDGRKAIFQPPGKERAIVVEVGEIVGDWRVQDIAADAVTLTGPGGTRRLEPKFAAASNANMAFPPPPGPQNGPAPGPGVPLFGGAQQNGGMDRPQGKH